MGSGCALAEECEMESRWTARIDGREVEDGLVTVRRVALIGDAVADLGSERSDLR